MGAGEHALPGPQASYPAIRNAASAVGAAEAVRYTRGHIPGEVSAVRRGTGGQKLFAAFLLGCLLFDYPLLYLFHGPTVVFGIPLLYLYLFGTWAGLIALMAAIVQK
jgi:hypothetical protein